MWRADSLEKTLRLGKIEGRRRRKRQRMRWLDASLSQWTWVWVNSQSWSWTGRPGVVRFMQLHGVGHDWVTELNWTEWSRGFPYFLQCNSKFGNKEFMIWITISSQSYFCWLYRASPSFAAKNIIYLIIMLTIWWWPCVVFSCVVGTECLLWPVDSLGRTLLAFFLLHSVLQGQICLLLQVFLNFVLLHSSPL